MELEELRERLAEVERELHDLCASGDGDQSAQRIERIADLSAERCSLRSRMADDPRDALAWCKREVDYRKSQAHAHELQWTDKLREALTTSSAQDELAKEFAAQADRLARDKSDRGVH
jgi:hypothetical protein